MGGGADCIQVIRTMAVRREGGGGADCIQVIRTMAVRRGGRQTVSRL